MEPPKWHGLPAAVPDRLSTGVDDTVLDTRWCKRKWNEAGAFRDRAPCCASVSNQVCFYLEGWSLTLPSYDAGCSIAASGRGHGLWTTITAQQPFEASFPRISTSPSQKSSSTAGVGPRKWIEKASCTVECTQSRTCPTWPSSRQSVYSHQCEFFPSVDRHTHPPVLVPTAISKAS